MKLTKKRVAALGLLSFSFLFCLIVRILFDDILNAIIDAELKQKLPIKEGTMAYKYWIKPPVPIAFKIYVFDIVNPEEILSGTSVPIVNEKGPYVYRMHLKKTNIKFHKENYTVEYRQPEKFVYDRAASVGSENDTFTTINIPFMTVANVLKNEFRWMQIITDAFFRSMNESTFMTRSVHDIWWGYKDPVLQLGADILKTFNISISILNGKFGFYMDRNNTDDGLFNVFSGQNHNFSNYVMIDTWNRMKHQSAWKSDLANRIKGSGDGSMQPPRITKDAELSVFDTNLKRTLKLVYNRTSSYKGVDALRFLIPYSEFFNAKDNPDNAGYCTPDVEHCLPSGAINMSDLYYSAPVCASLPHFLGGDPYYQRQVKGLKPSQDKHQPFYDYHALTGVALTGSRRYQLVLKTRPYKNFESFKNMVNAYIPILWIDGLAQLDEETSHMFKTQIQDLLDAMVYVKVVLIVLTCVAGLAFVLLIVYWNRKDKKKVSSEHITERSPLLKNGSIQSYSEGNGVVSNGTYDQIERPSTDHI
ncbi:scavenger receptor class b member 1 [Plakobranchus ocellatus]|uniref:Scavenger receptor class b member 1 n=1 Tax=Plakobranchus ocellatus TaxID=259542 RepID=A0AAV3YGS4_9GAST|nr:scavenger receptor class b member 1 [Plakobranchus ocellatus]